MLAKVSKFEFHIAERLRSYTTSKLRRVLKISLLLRPEYGESADLWCDDEWKDKPGTSKVELCKTKKADQMVEKFPNTNVYLCKQRLHEMPQLLLTFITNYNFNRFFLLLLKIHLV